MHSERYVTPLNHKLARLATGGAPLHDQLLKLGGRFAANSVGVT